MSAVARTGGFPSVSSFVHVCGWRVEPSAIPHPVGKRLTAVKHKTAEAVDDEVKLSSITRARSTSQQATVVQLLKPHSGRCLTTGDRQRPGLGPMQVLEDPGV